MYKEYFHFFRLQVTVCVWLVAENPLEIFRRMGKLINSSEFPRGNSVAINYTRCCDTFYFNFQPL